MVVSLRFSPALAPGVRWYRLHLKLPTARPPMGLLLYVPKNGYEVFINGKHAEGRIGPALAFVSAGCPFRATARRVRCMDSPYLAVDGNNGSPLSVAAVGLWPVVKELTAEFDLRQFAYLASSMAMDIAVCSGGLAVLGLFLVQRTRREYLWLAAQRARGT